MTELSLLICYIKYNTKPTCVFYQEIIKRKANRRQYRLSNSTLVSTLTNGGRFLTRTLLLSKTWHRNGLPLTSVSW